MQRVHSLNVQELDYGIAFELCLIYQSHSLRYGLCPRPKNTELTIHQIMSTIQKHIWGEVARLESPLVDIILDELVRTATDGGIGTRRCETICHIVAALSSINVRGRIYSKLRKVCQLVGGMLQS